MFEKLVSVHSSRILTVLWCLVLTPTVFFLLVGRGAIADRLWNILPNALMLPITYYGFYGFLFLIYRQHTHRVYRPRLRTFLRSCAFFYFFSLFFLALHTANIIWALSTGNGIQPGAVFVVAIPLAITHIWVKHVQPEFLNDEQAGAA